MMGHQAVWTHTAAIRPFSFSAFQVTLTTNHKKMEAEVKSLRFQLESERSRYKTMQSDLQKELNVAFEENTKLTTLLDGKVPKSRLSIWVVFGKPALHSDLSCNSSLFQQI